MKKILTLTLAAVFAVSPLFARPDENRSRNNRNYNNRPRPSQRPDRYNRPNRYEPIKHHYNKPKKPNWNWGVNFSPYGVGIGAGVNVGKHGYIGVSYPLISTRPSYSYNYTPIVQEKTIIVQQPAVQPIQQTIVVQQPADQIVVTQPTVTTTTTTYNPEIRVWVEGYWKNYYNADGSIFSKKWVPGHWE